MYHPHSFLFSQVVSPELMSILETEQVDNNHTLLSSIPFLFQTYLILPISFF